jgi:hypothetical protein
VDRAYGRAYAPAGVLGVGRYWYRPDGEPGTGPAPADAGIYVITADDGWRSYGQVVFPGRGQGDAPAVRAVFGEPGQDAGVDLASHAGALAEYRRLRPGGSRPD